MAKRIAVSLLLIVLSRPALAQKKPPTTEGVRSLFTVRPEQGFVDDAYALDGPGGRLALVRTDAASYTEVEIVDLNQGGASLHKFALTQITIAPLRMSFVGDGDRLFVVGKVGEDRVTGALVGFDGKAIRSWGPATDIAVTEIDGAEAVAVFDAAAKNGKTYEVSIFRLRDGKALAKKRQFVADNEGFVKSLDMKILYWRHGYTQLVGRKRGGYDRALDQRMNDHEAVYDLVVGGIARTFVPTDLVAYTKLLELRTPRSNQEVFMAVTEDLTGVELIAADDRRVPISFPEAFSHYEPKSLAFEVGRDGKIYFSLTIDPVNPDAVARKVADPELIDLFVLDEKTGAATRLARAPKDARPFSWRIRGNRWVILRKHKAFSRGGASLEAYALLPDQ